MSKKIICAQMDYSDEFDYPIVSVFTEEVQKEILDNIEKIPEENEIYFGTNEFLMVSRQTLKTMVEFARDISDEELKVLKRYSVTNFGVDIVDYILDEIEGEERGEDD